VTARRAVMAAATLLAAACASPATAPGSVASPAPAASPDTAVAGTYELVLCDGCDAAAVPGAQRIRISLYAEPIFVSGPLAGADPPYGVRIFRRMRTLERENYCMAIPPGYARGLVGAVHDTAIAVWTRTAGDSIRFPLYLSPDAGVEARVRIENGRMSGVLEHWFVPGPPTAVRGGIVGVRVGAPDPAVCGLRDAVLGVGAGTSR